MADGPVESGDADRIAVSVYIGSTLVRHVCIQPWSRLSPTLPCLRLYPALPYSTLDGVSMLTSLNP
jgi:hypothetical protein